MQYLAIRYTDRLADAGAVVSVGSRGDSYDNALAETTIGLLKTELIGRQGPWQSAEQVELAMLGWIDWYNQRRLHSACGHRPSTKPNMTTSRPTPPSRPSCPRPWQRPALPLQPGNPPSTNHGAVQSSVLLKIHAKCLDGEDGHLRRRVEVALRHEACRDGHERQDDGEASPTP